MDGIKRVSIDCEVAPRMLFSSAKNLVSGTINGNGWYYVKSDFKPQYFIGNHDESGSFSGGTFELHNDDESYCVIQSSTFSVVAGKYTYSFDFMSDSASKSKVYVYDKNYTDAEKNAIMVMVDGANVGKWIRVTHTLDIDEHFDLSSIGVRVDVQKQTTVKIRNLMFTRGEEPSPWGPAEGETSATVPIEIPLTVS